MRAERARIGREDGDIVGERCSREEEGGGARGGEEGGWERGCEKGEVVERGRGGRDGRTMGVFWDEEVGREADEVEVGQCR